MVVSLLVALTIGWAAVCTCEAALAKENKAANESGYGTAIVTWHRYDISCTDFLKSWRRKTMCNAVGQNHNTAQYCN